MSKYLTPIAIVLAGLIVGGAVMYTNMKQAATATPGTAPVAKVDIKDVNIAGEPYIGSSSAPLVMAAWTDYQCPFCKAVEVGGIPQIPIQPSMPTLLKDYVATGKLKIVFKDYQFLGPDSVTAALAGRAVWELYPDKYMEWRTAMFTKQDGENAGFGNRASIIALTQTIAGIDASKVSHAMEDNKAKYQAAIDADRAEGTKFGIQGTPGFIIGTQLLSGAEDLAAFKSAIDSQLK